jgi:transcriptional regulator with XRE-family HTH domain
MIKTPRQAGQALRDLRKKARLTGGELGVRAGLSQSKISKIENGQYGKLAPEEVNKLLNILKAPSSISQQIHLVIGSIDHGSRTFVPYDINDFSKTNSPQEKRAHYVRIHTIVGVPALLQTAEYRTVLLRQHGQDENAIAKNLKQTFARQDLLWDTGRQFRILMPQAALYTYAGSKTVQLAQLDRLERMTSLTNLRLGILPTEAGMAFFDMGPFALYDEHTLAMPVASGDLATQDKTEIEYALDVFAALEKLACYDADAIELIRKAAAYFS